MARKTYDERQDEAHDRDRWIVSYADFITLLFAFFVVMYAMSSVNEGKYRDFSDALGTAFGVNPLARPDFGVVPPAPPAIGMKRRSSDLALRRDKEALTGIARDLQKLLAPLVRDGTVRVTQNGRGVVVEINASVLFAPGDARLTEQSGAALKAVAAILKDDNHEIQVEGHSDNIPINSPAFPSNWELSAVRAGTVVRLFINNGVAEQRLTAVGRGPNLPVASNDTPQGRARNRRVSVTIFSKLPDPATPVPIGPTSAK